MVHRSAHGGWFAAVAAAIAGCSGGGTIDADGPGTDTAPPVASPGAGPTYWRDAEPILARSCTGCHEEGGAAPFPLTGYPDASAWGPALAVAVSAGTMPPWPPSADCAPLLGDRSLSATDRDALLAWVEAGTPEGDPADASPPPDPPAQREVDTSIALDAPYTPEPDTDDYRCFLMPWTVPDERYVTWFEVAPGQRDIVHHVILSVLTDTAAADAQALDDADPGPGYGCVSLPGGAMLGSWVPGVSAVDLPPGTGVRVAPGSTVVAQIHYNTTTTAPSPDQTSVAFGLASSVAYPAQGVPLLDIGWLLPGGMSIPAGSTGVEVAGSLSGRALAAIASAELDLAPGESIRVHRVGLHMHTLGVSGGVRVLRADGSDACLLEVPAWDFHWQGQYALAEPVTVEPDDEVELWCRWDNDGPNAVDVAWGEATSDEMCLSGLYVTR